MLFLLWRTLIQPLNPAHRCQWPGVQGRLPERASSGYCKRQSLLWSGEQHRPGTRRSRLCAIIIHRRAACAGGAARRAAGDSGSPHTAAAGAVAHRSMVLRRPLRTARPPQRSRHGRSAASAHRAADRQLAVQRRGGAPRQRGRACDGAAGRAEPDDRRRGDLPLRGVDAGVHRPARRAAVGGAARRPAATPTATSHTSRLRRGRWATQRCASSSASSQTPAHRCTPSRRCSVRSSISDRVPT